MTLSPRCRPASYATRPSPSRLTPRQLRDHAAGVCLALDMLGAGDFLQSEWEVIARGPSGWTGDRGVITPGSR